MLNNEIYVLVKHGLFQASYVENLPVYRRRYYLHLLNKEIDKQNQQAEEIKSKSKRKF